MLQFLQANWTLVLFGIALLLMFRMHSGGGHSMGGGGCGMGHQHGDTDEHGSAHEHGAHESGAKPIEPPIEKWGSAEKETPTPVATGAGHKGKGGGCH